MNNIEIQEYSSSRYRWIYKCSDISLCKQLSLQYNLPYPLAEVLYKRGITQAEQIQEYFETPLNSLINPFMMKDMEKGVERICKALKNNERICVYGDYDVDGVTSTSLLYLFFQELKGNVTYYIPNRLEEGYGLNADAIEQLATQGVRLIVTVDCGISANNEVGLANKLGMEVVITDHHQAGEELPAAYAIINPMQPEDDYPFKNLAGVGVAFKVCMAVRYHLRNDSSWTIPLPNLKKYLDIVTLGTIADVVSLSGENRTFVTHGLKALSDSNVRTGIDELKKVSGLSKVSMSSSHVGFGLAPRINAVGRLGDSDRGFKLLTTISQKEAKILASELDQENKFRQGIEREILEEVFALIDKDNLHEKHSGLVLYSNDWHPGVLGIVASRVADKYYRPTIILTEENNQLKGSARSVPGFHLYDGLKDLSELLISFGGHKYAAGLKIKKENISILQERFDKLVKDRLTDKDYMPEINIDSYLEPTDLNSSFMDNLQKFEPYGNNNKEPVFCMKDVEKYQEITFVGRDMSHAKMYLIKKGIVFDGIGYDLKCYEHILKNNNLFDIIFTLSYNNYSRDRSVQLIIKDIKVAENNQGKL